MIKKMVLFQSLRQMKAQRLVFLL